MTTAGFRKGDKIGRFEKGLDDPSRVLKQVGALMVAESQQAFKAQQFGKNKWRPRAPVNIYGIIADFAAGKKTPPKRRFEDRPALRDTGRLASSIAFKVIGRTVTVGSNLEYAGVHQTGGAIESMPITKDVQQKVADFISRGSVSDAVFNRLAFLLDKRLTGTTLKGEVEARPFVGITKRTLTDVRQAVGVTIFEVR